MTSGNNDEILRLDLNNHMLQRPHHRPPQVLHASQRAVTDGVAVEVFDKAEVAEFEESYSIWRDKIMR